MASTVFLSLMNAYKKCSKDCINSRDFDSEAIFMAKVVKIIWREIFERESFNFLVASHAIVKKIP